MEAICNHPLRKNLLVPSSPYNSQFTIVVSKFEIIGDIIKLILVKEFNERIRYIAGK